MKKKHTILLLVCALSLPLPSTAVAMEDLFGAMFRMMLVMMNVMSNAMLDNSNTSNFGSTGSFGFGMDNWPTTNGLTTLYPATSVNSYPGMTPWSGMGGVPGMTPWSGMGGVPGMSPWSGMGGFPGMTPWSGTGGVPGTGTGMMPWAFPYTQGSLPYANAPYNSAGYGGWRSIQPSTQASLLDGRWYGYTGELLEVRGDRFLLKYGQYSISGTVNLENNIVNLYSTQTDTVMQYTFVRNQSELMLQDSTGQILRFTNQPLNNVIHVF
jgi:hypothetical protein